MANRKLWRGLGYAGFTLVALLGSCYFTFPSDAVGHRLAYEISRGTDGAVQLQFGEVSPYRLTGLQAEDVKVRWMSDPGSEPLEVRIDEVRLRLHLLPLLLLNLAGEVDLELGKGSVVLAVAPDGEGGGSAEISIEDLNLASPALLPQLAGIPIAGVATGEAEVVWHKDMRETEGSVVLHIANSSVGPGKVGGFTLPGIALGTLDAKLEGKGGKLTLSSFKQQGGDVGLQLSADSALQTRLSASTLDGCVKVKPEEAFLAKNPKLKTVMELAQVTYRKDRDGFLNIRLGGALGRPRPQRGLCRGVKR